MSSIPTWVYTVTALGLIFATVIVAYQTQGGIKRPTQLLVLFVVTTSYLFSLTFIHDVTPQLGLDLRGGVSVVLEAKDNPSSEELDLAVDVIRDRVDALGVAEPEISRQGNSIVVDLPGAKDARRAQELIGQTAELRFRQVAENDQTDQSVALVLNQICANDTRGPNACNPNARSANSSDSTSSSASTSSTTPSSSTTSAGGPGKSFRRDEPAATESTASTAPSSIATAPTPATTSSEYPTSLTVQCGGTNPQSYTLEGNLTRVTPRANDIADQPIIAWDKPNDDKTARRPYLLCPTVLKGDIVKTAQTNVGSLGELTVGVELTGDGAQQFTQLIGGPLSGQRVAIVLDSKVISAPTIQPDLANGLTDNSLEITMGEDASQSEVENLVTVLRYGKLPVVLEQQTAQKVSPTLGSDQLRAGLFAGAVGLFLVILYMLLYYRILGMVVVAGLTLTGMLTYALICWLGQSQGLSLTLAGAVGLIVSLGVTVDSYVVYFEKLKDEVKQGRSVRSSLDPAFKASFRTIFAADLVSLMGAAALFFIASGSVRGFAFFLGLSTALDLLVSICFMHPCVKLISRRPSFITNKYFGMGAALDKKDLTA